MTASYHVPISATAAGLMLLEPAARPPGLTDPVFSGRMRRWGSQQEVTGQ